MTHQTNTPTILIVDDTPSNLGMVVKLMEDRDYRVCIAQDGEEGLLRAELLQPDLILLDVMMPGVDGFEICRRLKMQEATRDIPVIFMTALASSEHKVKGFAAGGVDYLTKPLYFEEVMARVDTHIRLHAAQRQLEKQNLRLEKHGEELELRVAARTAALDESNAQLSKREQQFRTLAENLPDNLARYDKQCRKVYLNPQLESLLGEQIETKLGKTPIESHPGPVYVEYQARLLETISTGQPNEIELVLPDRGDGIRHHHIRFVAERDASGEIVGALTIGRDITERKFAERELEESRAQLRGMTARREEVREEERKYIARQVHDELGQILTGLQLNISVLEHKFAPELPPLFEHLKETRVLMDRALSVARNVASSLRPAVLDMGILSALEWLIGRFDANTGIRCQMHVDENEIQMDERHAITLYRILQELLTNVSRHAEATRVDVTFVKEGVDCCLKVCDNGKGFVMNEKQMDSFGLVSIKERVLMLRGCVVIESSPGMGTQIDVRIPVNEKVLIHD